MKAIITRADKNGVFGDVGMSDRTVVSYEQDWRIRRAAREFAQGRAIRIEYYPDDAIYGKPERVATIPADK